MLQNHLPPLLLEYHHDAPRTRITRRPPIIHSAQQEHCHCFSATWCATNERSKPDLEALAAQYATDVTKNVAFGIAYEHTCIDAFLKYGIQAFPTYVLFQNEREVERVQANHGVNVDDIRSMIDDAAHLPFGCRKNHCLMSAYEQGAVSPGCAGALRQVEEANQIEVSHQELVIEREKKPSLDSLFCMESCVLGHVFLLHRRLSKLGRKMRGKHRLKRRILQAVYNNPDIKAAVAGELNEDLGHVPPLPPHVLARTSADAAAGKLTDAQACCCCCQGTGVCAGSGCGCCCCCGGTCCCSDKSSSKKLPVRYAKEKAYMGIPVQVV